MYFLFLNCRFSNKNAFHVHVTAQASYGNVLALTLTGHFVVLEEPFCF